jgi:hypothetical protein
MAGQGRAGFSKKTQMRVNLGEFLSIPGEVAKYPVVKRYKIVPVNS